MPAVSFCGNGAEDAAQQQEGERDGDCIEQDSAHPAGEGVEERDDHRCRVDEGIGDDAPDRGKVQEHVAFHPVLFEAVEDRVQHDIRGDAAGDRHGQEITGDARDHRRFFDIVPDIRHNLFGLVLLLQEFCNNCPAEDDDAKRGKYFPDPHNDPQHGRVQGHACQKPEEHRPADQGEERGDPVPEAAEGDENKGDHERDEGIHG
jgi:hypothetical protein